MQEAPIFALQSSAEGCSFNYYDVVEGRISSARCVVHNQCDICRGPFKLNQEAAHDIYEIIFHFKAPQFITFELA